jgi:hypothetical protein
MTSVIQPIDLAALRSQFTTAEPFPFFKIDNFLAPAFAREVAAAYPTYENARKLGFEFQAVNEKVKIQITERERFPESIKILADALSSPKFLSDLEFITGIPRLLADAKFAGGGMHVSGPGGRLDVHVDFNYVEDRKLHRRLNILVYLNPDWHGAWGGNIELWDSTVSNCRHSFEPIFNRCVVFETSDISYHGVTPITCPTDKLRRSFAAYYYTAEAPANWDGTQHSTIFRARPDEVIRGKVLMPMEALHRRVRTAWQETKRRTKSLIGR